MSGTVENPEYVQMLRRLVRAAGRRFGENPDDIAHLAHLQSDLDACLRAAVTRARADYGLSWTEVGQLLGVSRQAAQQRFGQRPVALALPAARPLDPIPNVTLTTLRLPREAD